jgi:beta-aspartyl-peptidase (threonine type)
MFQLFALVFFIRGRCKKLITGKKLLDFGIIVHGGAGSFTPGPDLSKRRRVLEESATAGYAELEKRGGSSLDAVEESIKVLEDSKVFNAGAGSSLSIEATVSADAAIMRGRDLGCGSIGNVSIHSNPISLARLVMENSDHVFLVGSEQLLKFTRAIGVKSKPLVPSEQRLKQYKDNIAMMKSGKIKAWPRNYKLLRSYQTSRGLAPENSDTVGAVAIDSSSNVCAGVSTGGRWLKLPGRVGDSAIVGAGIYADNVSGAASATGAGEEIIRVCLCKAACDFMRDGADAQSACDAAINILTDRRGVGTAGVIAIDKFGRFGAARNTEMLQRAFRFKSMKKTHVALLPTEKDPTRPDYDLGDPRLRF